MKNLKQIVLIISLLSFLMVSAEDYYWVGGQGSWSNLNHWRTLSGQIPSEVPDDADNVIFNGSSFLAAYDTVFITTGNPVCYNMIWQDIQDTVVIWGGTNASNFVIYGSITFHENVLNFYYGKITLVSDEATNTITCNHAKFSGDLYFDGSGTWTLQDTLFAYDSLDWKEIIFSGVEPLDPNPQIFIKQGNVDVNEQTIICRGLHLIGTQTKSFDFSNSHCLMVGDWNLISDNLTFDASNSYILIGGNMSNSFGDDVHYYDIDVMGVSGSIKNTKIRSFHRKIHYLGGGKLEGAVVPGSEGHFTIDTLIMEGAFTMAGPINDEVSGNEHNIHYSQFKLTAGMVDANSGNFHRMDYEGYLAGYFRGTADIIDSIHFFNPADTLGEQISPPGTVAHNVVINNLLYFGSDGVIGSGWGEENQINRAVFIGDGWFEGNNHMDSLTLSSGHWYQMQADSLTHPGSFHNFNRVQTIGQIDVLGDCNSGMVIITSDFKEIFGIINYTGNDYPTSYIQVKDMFNQGNPLIIENGINAGNVNDKFEFTNPREPRELYWVGSTGNWSDILHWSLDPNAIVGDQCIPTLLDNVYFTATSGFDLDDSVYADVTHLWCKDMTWESDIPDTVTFSGFNTLHIWGSLKLDPMMSYRFGGDVYFESEDDTEYETIDFYNSDIASGTRVQNAFGKVYFYGRNGKWELESNLSNFSDTTFLRMGDLKLDNDTMDLRLFIAMDTLVKKMSLLHHSMVKLHLYQGDAWVFWSYKYNQNSFFDAGKSTIQSIGDHSPPGPTDPPGYCHIRSMGDSLIYHNILFGDSALAPGTLVPVKSMLKSENEVAIYNLVDFYLQNGVLEGHGEIDTLTFHDHTDAMGNVIEATGCNLKTHYAVNFLYAESDGDTIIQSHIIDTAYFDKPGKISGFNFIKYLEAKKYLEFEGINQTQRAIFYGNAGFYQRNTFDTMQVSPNRRYTFQQIMGDLDTTIITHDLNAIGNCDAPIRFQSAVVGTPAKILYTALAPSNPGVLINYGSMRDIEMLPPETTFNANNSVDLGNNSTNINFSSDDITTFYWINGVGSWGDWYHWSDESGGAPISLQCTPRELTNVIFDDNSFDTPTDTVLIDIPNAYCNNMRWIFTDPTFKPVFLGADTTVLFVYGSMQLHDSMDYQYGGEVFFNNIDTPGDLPDTIYSHNQVFLNNVIFQGINDEVILEGDMTLFVDQANGVYNSIYLQHGKLRSAGYEISTAGLLSNYQNQRTLDIRNSWVNLAFDEDRSLWLDATNLELQADFSTINDLSNTACLYTENGTDLYFHNLIMNGIGDSLYNKYNTTHYNVVQILGDLTLLKGNYTADSVLFAANQSLMDQHAQINFLHVTGKSNQLLGDNQIITCWFYNDGIIRNGNQFGKLMANGNVRFRGSNTADSLYLFPGSGDGKSTGNKYYFENNKEQLVNEYLWMRGNQCSNMTIQNDPGTLFDFGTIRMVNGTADVVCDYLDILNVNVVSDLNWKFYAGVNSSIGRVPTSPPTGWIEDNQQGYVFGFDGRIERFCLGQAFTLDAENFNGDPLTQYFWGGSPYPGGTTMTVTEPGTYQIHVKYSEECDVFDEITLVGDDPPIAVIDPGPFCAGDEIGVTVSPDYIDYQYYWSTGENTSTIIADLSYTGGIAVNVTDPTNNCKATPNQTILVKPSPDPEAALGNDITLDNGQSVTLDAGWGNSWLWTSDPVTVIEPNNQQFITVPGNSDTVTYFVEVVINGCVNTGSIKVNEWPPSKLGVPTAFSPNGDGDNDELKVLGSGFAKLTFQVYDRYGKLVFETDDQSRGWDGTVNGQKQEMDVYTYYVKVIYLDSGVAEEKGNITLLR